MKIRKGYCTSCFVTAYFDENDLDPRCYTCRFAAKPRQMVLGDIVDWSDSHSETWQAPRCTSFCSWANNTRTMALIQRCVQAETARDNQLFNVQLLKQQVEDLQRKLKNYEPVNRYNGLNIEQWKTRAEINWVEGWEAGWKASEERILTVGAHIRHS